MRQHEYHVYHVDTVILRLLFSGLTTGTITAVCDLEQITISTLLRIPLLIRDCHPSLPKIPFVFHFDVFT